MEHIGKPGSSSDKLKLTSCMCDITTDNIPQLNYLYSFTSKEDGQGCIGRQELSKCCVTVQVFELYRLLDPTKALVCRLSGNSARSLMELCCLQVRYLPFVCL